MISLTIPQLIIIFGLILLFAELFIGIDTGFDLVLIGSILILSGFVGLYTSTNTTLIISIFLSIVYITYGRSFVKKKLIILTHKTNIDKLIGQTGICIRSITPDTAGLIRLNDEDWRASSNTTIFEKDKVKVEAIEGVTLIVNSNKK
jgi:membrane protein implicated in regulation of membrane protease activity